VRYPGVVFANRPIQRQGASVIDVAGTVLDQLGLADKLPTQGSPLL